ncbi:MAG: IgGFc-binding protein [Sandaracinaceae bacterium]|nr:IgGFc-binding protein [Sandaracinaceae bacterium]
MRTYATLLACSFFAVACTAGNTDTRDAGMISPFVDGSFTCVSAEARACVGNVYHSCISDGEFLSVARRDCTTEELVCVASLSGCAVCRPDEVYCEGNDVVQCNAEGSAFEVVEMCDLSAGFVCRQGRCENLCALADRERSYLGCEFYTVDLDNAALGAGRDASSQQYSVVVSNPSGQPTEVVVELNRAAPGEEPELVELSRVTVLAGDLEVFDLPRREVDGSSSFVPCDASAQCEIGEACWCAGSLRAEDPPPAGGHRDCRCRVAAGSNGLNDGTHSALTSRAYRVTSVLPIVAYQFNPLANFGVFSNDASLLIPSSAYGPRYTVASWPQTIANSDLSTEDFDNRVMDEDLRAFLTIVGAEAGTHVTVTLGPLVRRVVGLGGRPDGVAGDVWEFDIGPFDVINLETWGFNADFTGTLVEGTRPIGVFTGSEASDAPRFNIIQNRQCCADHVETQLFPNDTLGRHFFVGRQPTRSHMLNQAFLDPTRDSVGEFDEPEYVRVVAVEDGLTTITTTLPPPDNHIELGAAGESGILIASQDFEITSDRAIAVLQVLPSQEATGIPSEYPGGDPAIFAVPPAEQYRNDYVFLTPDLYAFDSLVIIAPRAAQILLDEHPLTDFTCTSAPADGIRRRDGDPPPEWLVYRCQLSFPDVVGLPNVRVEEGLQDDGYHTLRATEDVGLVVAGFDAFVSYAYAGGLNLDPIE